VTEEVLMDGREQTRAYRAYSAFMALFVLTFIVINVVQAHQTGHGSGVNDTRILSPSDASHFVDAPQIP
jgi:hypothetical protein